MSAKAGDAPGDDGTQQVRLRRIAQPAAICVFVGSPGVEIYVRRWALPLTLSICAV
jgi:hypothetical protein